MSRDSISKTAHANLQMLAELGLPVAVRFRDTLQLEGDPLAMLSRIPLARRIPACVSTISEILYQSANQLILQEDNPVILDIACGYSLSGKNLKLSASKLVPVAIPIFLPL